MKIALAQHDFFVGDVDGNAGRIVELAVEARDRHGARLILFPELALTGYPPEDLLLRPNFIDLVERKLHELMPRVRGIDVLLGLPLREDGLLRNCAVWLRDGRIHARYDKQILPNHSVFDEKRYFAPDQQACVVEIDGHRVGVTICEDIWHPEPACAARDAGAQLIVNINASPYHLGKHAERMQVLRDRVAETGLPVVYLNLVGGQDELVFDGESLALGRDGGLRFRAPPFREGLHLLEFDGADLLAAEIATPPGEDEGLYAALVTGVRDYARKNGFRGAVLGLSGGIDSALTLCIAVDALGADAVEAVMMPYRYTADISIEDSRLIAQTLGVKYREIPIAPMVEGFMSGLAAEFAGLPPGTAEENIQARCRGIVLMAISNKTGRLLLTTGNKSEMAVGYATLYGDMAGGFAPLKDVSKLRVFRLAEHRNGIAPVIPRRIIERPPSAELAPDQKDEDSLPPYAVLDPILERFVECDRSVEEIVREGFDEATVRRVASMVLLNEYKRRQSPPGVRVTGRAFGKDRRYPITSGYGRLI